MRIKTQWWKHSYCWVNFPFVWNRKENTVSLNANSEMSSLLGFLKWKWNILHWNSLLSRSNMCSYPLLRLRRALRRARMGSLALNEFWVMSRRASQLSLGSVFLDPPASVLSFCSSLKACSNSHSMCSLRHNTLVKNAFEHIASVLWMLPFFIFPKQSTTRLPDYVLISSLIGATLKTGSW